MRVTRANVRVVMNSANPRNPARHMSIAQQCDTISVLTRLAALERLIIQRARPASTDDLIV